MAVFTTSSQTSECIQERANDTSNKIPIEVICTVGLTAVGNAEHSELNKFSKRSRDAWDCGTNSLCNSNLSRLNVCIFKSNILLSPIEYLAHVTVYQEIKSGE